MPPASEELDVRDNTLYILFESAGEKYYEEPTGKAKSLFPLDKIFKNPDQGAGCERFIDIRDMIFFHLRLTLRRKVFGQQITQQFDFRLCEINMVFLCLPHI